MPDLYTKRGKFVPASDIMRSDTSATYPWTVSSGNNHGIWTKSTATSGDSRGLYWRHYLSGTGISGEAFRVFATLDATSAANGTVNGAHVSLSFGADGNIAGDGNALRATIHVPNRAVSASGNYSALKAEAYLDGTSSDISTATTHSLFHAVVAGGDATAQAKFKYFLNLECPDGNGYMVRTAQNEPTWGSKTAYIQCLINGTVHWIVAFKA